MAALFDEIDTKCCQAYVSSKSTWIDPEVTSASWRQNKCLQKMHGPPPTTCPNKTREKPNRGNPYEYRVATSPSVCAYTVKQQHEITGFKNTFIRTNKANKYGQQSRPRVRRQADLSSKGGQLAPKRVLQNELSPMSPLRQRVQTSPGTWEKPKWENPWH